jgi:hypothetical protein
LRLDCTFSKGATDGGRYNKDSFVRAARAAYGHDKDARRLVWLDAVAAQHCGDGWKVTFDLCLKPEGGKREKAHPYAALVVPMPGSPEGFTIIEMQATYAPEGTDAALGVYH